MQSNYKPIGDYIQLVDVRNKDLRIETLLGLTINKQFIPSVANTVGTDMSNYKIIRKNQFACSTMQVRRDKKMPVALLKELDEAIISQAYPIFEVKDEKELLPEYLMMWFSREEFDREACFHAVGGVRGSLEWDDFCNMKFPLPSPEKQSKIVAEYNTVKNRIELNNQLIQKLEETAQAIYKQWFVDFEFPDENGNPYKSSGGKMVYHEELDKEIPEGWSCKELKELCSKIGSGATPKGGKESYHARGVSLIRSTNVHDYRFSTDELAYINDQQAEALKSVVVESKDILFNITGVSVARCTIVPDSVLPARVNQHVMIIRPQIQANYYLQFLLCHWESKSKLLGISQSGSTREAITKSDIEFFRISLPTNGIIEKFENMVSRLHGAAESRRKQSQILKSLLNLLHSKLATIEN
ncbi:MAG: restriction endonuclease subunit S [Prolixibacteraceae bacterium]|jgi:type I restriction enzyme S subunit|nr:restriction endonuclease subunit S [Prolixibacteraceae bacterium]